MTPNCSRDSFLHKKRVKEKQWTKLKKKPTVQDKVNLKISQKLIFEKELSTKLLKLSLVVSCDMTTEIDVVVHVAQ